MRRALAILTAALGACSALVSEEQPYGRVDVRAVSRSGVPLPDIAVMLYTGARPMGYDTTDAEGRASFSRVPPDEYGVRMTLPEGYADLSELQAGPPGTTRDGLSVRAGETVTADFTFARRGPGALEILARDSANAPLPGLTFTVYNSIRVLGQARTGADGLVRVDSVPFGSVGVSIITPDTLGTPPALRFRDGLIVDRDVVPRATFTFATCLGTLTVTVRDQSDVPIAGLDVTRYDSRAVRGALRTDAGGVVNFLRVPCGEYGLRLEPAPGFTIDPSRGLGFLDGVVVTRGASVSVTLRATRL